MESDRTGFYRLFEKANKISEHLESLFVNAGSRNDFSFVLNYKATSMLSLYYFTPRKGFPALSD